MKLLKYRVRKFRSVQDSGWITIDQVNALLGENESGKTNLLLPLWKLNPSSGGEISLLSDAPRGEYSEIRDLPDKDKPQFISALFQLDEHEMNKVAEVAECETSWVEQVQISRHYDGLYRVLFPKANPQRTCAPEDITRVLNDLEESLNSLTPNKTDEKPRLAIIEIIGQVVSEVEKNTAQISTKDLQEVVSRVESIDMTRVSKTGGILEMRRQCLDGLQEKLDEISAESPSQVKAARQKAIALMPNFIYYSNYGNLDGQIYLPRVIEDMENDDLTEKEEAKTRTLKVLFEYVKLKPEEILELGRDIRPDSASEETIEAKAEEKRERTVLLNSASASMTKTFAEWWRQGNYVFQFRADGDHFKIWVSDSLRTDPIELENRSTGLQWFFSFFLIFLNERHDTHHGSILLLDEPGVTLHPMAQKDLFSFFEGLSADNQILYTTHSPFLMDPDKLDQVKAVYVDSEGYSVVSDDLRARANSGTESEQKAIFPVHSALGLTVSEVLFVGCELILVEGPSDQFYLNAIKNILIGRGAITPSREIVFVPAGGTRGIKSTSRILAYDENDYPSVLLDGDAAGRETKKQLDDSLYAGNEDRVVLASDYCGIQDCEVEDIVDAQLVAKIATREFRGRDDFEDVFDDNKPIIPQIKAYCETENIDLSKGWKVDIARAVKRKMSIGSYATNVDQHLIDRWVSLFQKWL